MQGPGRRVWVAEVSVPERNLACQIQLVPIQLAIQCLRRWASGGLGWWGVACMAWPPGSGCGNLVSAGGSAMVGLGCARTPTGSVGWIFSVASRLAVTAKAANLNWHSRLIYRETTLQSVRASG